MIRSKGGLLGLQVQKTDAGAFTIGDSTTTSIRNCYHDQTRPEDRKLADGASG